MVRPRLNVLRTFEAAARRLSFSHAAAELNISQAAVSQQMRNLEAYLGKVLFLRHHRAISLSAAGRTYFEAVHKALNQLDTVTDQLFATRQDQTIVVRCPSSVATLWLAPKIRAFQANNPGVQLQIKTHEKEFEGGQLNGVDLEIFVSGKNSFEADVQPLLNAVITPVCAPAYLDKQADLSPADLQCLDLIHILGYEEDWHRWFQSRGLNGARVPHGLAADSSLFAIDAALRGDGIFLGRRPFIDGYLKTGELVEVFDQPFHLHATYFLRQNTSARNAGLRGKVAAWLLGLAIS